uniref:Glycosyl transferase family 2 n=1 Tax=Geobacter sp. (strain M21) TaxID=443144 RepID=C6E5U5_GEOSM
MRSGAPSVSWVVPVFNQAQYLAGALESMLAQTFEDFELVVVDDGSTDQSAAIVRSFKDPRIVLLENSCNQGVSRSLNRGIRAALGKYIARMDGDDLSTPDRLARQVAFMEDNPAIAVCGSHVETFGAESRLVKRPVGSAAIKCFLLAGPPFTHPSVMLRRSVLEQHRLFYDEGMGAAQDYDLWFRLLQVAPGGNVDAVLLRHRLHEEQVSKDRWREQEANAAKVRGEVLSLLGVVFDAEELERHTRLFRDLLLPDAGHLEWAAAWLENIYRRNHLARVFEERALHEFLNATLEQYAARCAASGVTLSRGTVAFRPGLLSRFLRKLLA